MVAISKGTLATAVMNGRGEMNMSKAVAARYKESSQRTCEDYQ
jgi:hypothetical protein